MSEARGVGHNTADLQVSGSRVSASRDAHRHVTISQAGDDRLKAAKLLKIILVSL